MSLTPANNGWTCPHVTNVTGPCWKCAPASGICLKCSRPMDDHDHVGLAAPECWKVKR